MTAIAYRDGVLAADTLVAGGGMRSGYCSKIARAPDGSLAAAAGSCSESQEFLAQFARDGAPDFPLTKMAEGFGGLVIKPDGRVLTIDKLGYHEFEAPYYTEGSAFQFLAGAMAAGASAEKAVSLAIKFMELCGGEVQVEHLNKKGT